MDCSSLRKLVQEYLERRSFSSAAFYADVLISQSSMKSYSCYYEN